MALNRCKMAVFYFKAIRVFLARLMFAIHALLTIYQASIVYDEATFWCFTIFVAAVFVEGGVNITTRRGDETRWFCACIFLYLCSVVPPLWFLELHLSWDEYREDRGIHDDRANTSGSDVIFQELKALKLTPQLKLNFLEQTLLVILIIGRWILPKGEISREQLSNLLLIYLAVSADTIELFEVFKETKVRTNVRLTILILIIWTTSLLQFCLVITQPHKGKKMGWNDLAKSKSSASLPTNCPMEQQVKIRRVRPTCQIILTSIEIWAIIISMCLQDAPFLCMRLYLVIHYEIMSYSMFFFVCKNSLICLLQIYRLLVVICDIRAKSKAQIQASETMELLLYETPSQTQQLIHKDMPDVRFERGKEGDFAGLKLLLAITKTVSQAQIHKDCEDVRPRTNGEVVDTNLATETAGDSELENLLCKNDATTAMTDVENKPDDDEHYPQTFANSCSPGLPEFFYLNRDPSDGEDLRSEEDQ